jgi:hypothetical protein
MPNFGMLRRFNTRLDRWLAAVFCRRTASPTPKMLRECANILETAPYQRTSEARWLRELAERAN